MELPANISSADIEIMTAGMRAARSGQSRRACPYVEDTPAAQCWLAGWAHAAGTASIGQAIADACAEIAALSKAA